MNCVGGIGVRRRPQAPPPVVLPATARRRGGKGAAWGGDAHGAVAWRACVRAACGGTCPPEVAPPRAKLDAHGGGAARATCKRQPRTQKKQAGGLEARGAGGAVMNRMGRCCFQRWFVSAVLASRKQGARTPPEEMPRRALLLWRRAGRSARRAAANEAGPGSALRPLLPRGAASVDAGRHAGLQLQGQVQEVRGAAGVRHHHAASRSSSAQGAHQPKRETGEQGE